MALGARLRLCGGERSGLTNAPEKGGGEMGDKSPKATQKQKKQKDAKKTEKAKK